MTPQSERSTVPGRAASVRRQCMNPKVNRGRPLTEDERAFLRSYISKAYWKNAVRYESWAPHSYTKKPPVRGPEQDAYLRFIYLINICGYDRAFHKHTFRYIDIDGQTFWVCGVGLRDSGLINRADPEADEELWPG